MNLIEAFRKNVKNIFVGSHRGDDFILENIIKSEEKKMEKPNENENDFGVNPNEWFEEDHKAIDEEPLDLAPSSYEPPEDEPEDIHEQMYNIATAKYNPFAVGGSENIQDFNNVGGSEEVHK